MRASKSGVGLVRRLLASPDGAAVFRDSSDSKSLIAVVWLREFTSLFLAGFLRIDKDRECLHGRLCRTLCSANKSDSPNGSHTLAWLAAMR